jgi:hypothetical protein
MLFISVHILSIVKEKPTYAQCYGLFIELCPLVLQHVSANSYTIIRGYYCKFG